MKSISKTFSQLKFNKLEKCNPKPGYKDSCEGCKNCKKGKGLVYEEEVNVECCSGVQEPNFGNISENNSVINSDIITSYGNLECTYHLHVKFETTGSWDDGNQKVEFWDGANSVLLTRNQWYSFDYTHSLVVPTLYFIFTNNLAVNKCVMVHLKDTTCNVNYGSVGNFCSLMG